MFITTIAAKLLQSCPVTIGPPQAAAHPGSSLGFSGKNIGGLQLLLIPPFSQLASSFRTQKMITYFLLFTARNYHTQGSNCIAFIKRKER